jgi:hypothetical protein
MAGQAYELQEETREWLLDPVEPGARYLAFLKLGDLPTQDLENEADTAHREGPIKIVLDQIHPDGYWDNDGPGYLPKYRSTVWSLILLSQLGASVKYDQRITTACQRYLDVALSPNAQISTNGAPSGTADCLQGNMLTAMLDLGFEDERLQKAFEWMGRSLTGEGVAPMSDRKAPLRYYSGKIGPGFECGANNKLACAWGGTKVMLAFSKLPEERRTPLIKQAITRGIDFFLEADPAEVPFPNGWNPKPSGNWWKFGFPVFYVTDLLQVGEVLARHGLMNDARLVNLIQTILDKQDDQGRWLLEYNYPGKAWVEFGSKNQPNKWVTIRALETLNFADKKPILPA